MRYTVHKNLYKVSLFGPNDDWKNKSDSQYRAPGSSFSNGKICRFNRRIRGRRITARSEGSSEGVDLQCTTTSLLASPELRPSSSLLSFFTSPIFTSEVLVK